MQDAVTGEDKRALRFTEETRRLADQAGISRAAPRLDVFHDLISGVRAEDVRRDFNMYRARTSGAKACERLIQGRRNLVRRAHPRLPLGDSRQEPLLIETVEEIASQLALPIALRAGAEKEHAR